MMNVQSPRRGFGQAVPVLWIAGLLAVCSTGTALAATGASASPTTVRAKLSGKWKGHYSGAFSGKFAIRWTQKGSKLSGTITLSNPKGKYGIGGSVRHGKIKFGAVGVGATYKGSVHGTSMSGT